MIFFSDKYFSDMKFSKNDFLIKKMLSMIYFTSGIISLMTFFFLETKCFSQVTNTFFPWVLLLLLLLLLIRDAMPRLIRKYVYK